MRSFGLFFLGILLSGCSLLSPYTPSTYSESLPKLAQQTPTLSFDKEGLKEEYLAHFFSPWLTDKLGLTPEQAKWPWRVYTPEKPYYSETKQPRPAAWFEAQATNARFEAFGTLNRNAITVQNSALRNFPTALPLFRSFDTAGEGYPFDYNQNSRIPLMQPLKLSHYTKDGAWAFVKSAFSYGWIPANHITTLSSPLQQRIINAPKVMAIKDHKPLYDASGFATKVKLGTLLPLLENGLAFKVEKDESLTPLHAPLDTLLPWPLPFNQKTVYAVASSLLEEPYGWGGLFDHRDCSAMTKDFFAPFGLWLPRNSAAQNSKGKPFNLKNLTNTEKEALILRHGVPFLTLLYLPGHIMLYVGEHEGSAMVLHNMWGLKTSVFGWKGRHVIGKATITDLHVGANHPWVPTRNLLISKLTSMRILPHQSIKQRLVNAYPDAITTLKDNELFFKNGTVLPVGMPSSNAHTSRLENPSIKDHFHVDYPALSPLLTPLTDPGRFRNEAFFKALYGEDKAAVTSRLTTVHWLPSHENRPLLFHRDHGAARALQAVSDELDKLPSNLLNYVKTPAGTYNHRVIAGTNRLSMHSFGIAIDINTKYGHYWRWSPTLRYANNIPAQIVHIFEKHGFIWGGRWKHYDTFHFEYRPELAQP